ncbi:LysE family translocator [Photobacterium sp. 1_MG-2023]|uniref:LysE family translocator n=1 Tax=Photobacterium sp. 1_MG-2023 TaxID=3062646 RepID=UPI0026E22E42|nr:LysE family translocator [Photobacterium sp. 1_MG-2023]MDO6705839.1 LysE family translocator [Photobacterium sp. 1_MG-2023]
MESLLPVLIAYSTYCIGTLSPGPANLAIMGTSMASGRSAGLAIAFGVITGSVMWGVIAAFGLGTAVHRSVELFNLLKVLGGTYLLWLAYLSLKTVLSARSGSEAAASVNPEVQSTSPEGQQKHPVNRLGRHYLRGLGIHLTNPKAMVVWLAVISTGMNANSSSVTPSWIVLGCAVLGILIFSFYALAFSTPKMMAYYVQKKTLISLFMAVMFFIAAVTIYVDVLRAFY